jgi:hypothetical protein
MPNRIGNNTPDAAAPDLLLKEQLIRKLAVMVFNEWEAILTFRECSGSVTMVAKITGIDKETKRLRVENEGGSQWFSFDDLTEIQLVTAVFEQWSRPVIIP